MSQVAAQASQAYIMRVLCIFSQKRVGAALQVTVETLCEKYWGLQMLNIILVLLFFYKINKRDLPLMYL